jgi:hypothetical protein
LIKFCAVHQIGWYSPDHQVTTECSENPLPTTGLMMSGWMEAEDSGKRFPGTADRNVPARVRSLKKRRAKNKMRRASRNKNR